jgi:hypothetical protein
VRVYDCATVFQGGVLGLVIFVHSR